MSTEESFYQKKFLKNGNDVKSLGWGSEYSQKKRFKVLKQIGIASGDSVIDIGSGYADFYKFLSDQNIDVSLYTSCEKEEFFYEISEKRYKKFKNFKSIRSDFRNIKKEKYDWVVASGVFCFKSLDRKLYNDIEILWQLAEKGMAINFLSHYTEGIVQEGFIHYRPEEILSFFMNSISKKCVLRHDYLKNDFTVYAYRENQ